MSRTFDTHTSAGSWRRVSARPGGDTDPFLSAFTDGTMVAFERGRAEAVCERINEGFMGYVCGPNSDVSILGDPGDPSDYLAQASSPESFVIRWDWATGAMRPRVSPSLTASGVRVFPMLTMAEAELQEEDPQDVDIFTRTSGEPWTLDWTGSVDEFFSANDFDPEEVAAIRKALAGGSEYRIGGGAMPEARIEHVDTGGRRAPKPQFSSGVVETINRHRARIGGAPIDESAGWTPEELRKMAENIERHGREYNPGKLKRRLMR